jgi:small subunit ribosomal protein S6e
MVEFKVVIGLKDGKTVQKVIQGAEAENLLKKRIGQAISGDLLGMPGYEFLVSGGSDKCGFPMRKGIQEPRKVVLTGEGVGFCGMKRPRKKGKKRRNQEGLVRKRTVCGEMITKIIHQVNLKATKEGAQPLVAAEGGEAKA